MIADDVALLLDNLAVHQSKGRHIVLNKLPSSSAKRLPLRNPVEVPVLFDLPEETETEIKKKLITFCSKKGNFEESSGTDGINLVMESNEHKEVLPKRSSLRIATHISLQEAQQKTSYGKKSEEKNDLYHDEKSIPFDSLVGKRVSKYFRNGFNSWFDGTVVSFKLFPQGPYYRIKYDDGDAEDLGYKRTLKAIWDFKKRHPASPSTNDKSTTLDASTNDEAKVSCGKRRWTLDELVGEADGDDGGRALSAPKKRKKKHSTGKTTPTFDRAVAKKRVEQPRQQFPKTTVNTSPEVKGDDKQANGVFFFAPLKATAQAVFGWLKGAKLP